MARPEKKIDIDEMEKLYGLQCTDEEVAAFFGVSLRTIVRRRELKTFQDAKDRGMAKGRLSVRRNLFRLSTAGNVAATIFLSKNILGYKDYVASEMSGPNGGPIALGAAPEMEQLTDEELKQLALLVGKTQQPRKG
ncbi:MAG: hypothetical protein LAO79_04580 [Acidobacteriia bacterium]|nr:hypothetical protein [Terriglobia bacterium]